MVRVDVVLRAASANQIQFSYLQLFYCRFNMLLNGCHCCCSRVRTHRGGISVFQCSSLFCWWLPCLIPSAIFSRFADTVLQVGYRSVERHSGGNCPLIWGTQLAPLGELKQKYTGILHDFSKRSKRSLLSTSAGNP